MSCREFTDFMMDYVSGELPPEVMMAFEEHLSICPNCVVYLAQYRATIEAGRTAFADPDAEVPDQVPEELIRAILASRRA